MKTQKSVTNEDILSLLHEFMQLTSDNFLRLEDKIDNVDLKLSNKIDSVNLKLSNKIDSGDLKLSNKIDSLAKCMERQEKLSEDILERVIYLEHVTVKSV